MLRLDDLGQTAAPSFDAPLEMLVACHDKVRHFCSLLDKLPGYLAEHGVTPALQGSVDGILRYFDVAGPAHHADEEEELFPLLRQRLPDTDTPLSRLAADHVLLGQRWQVLRRQLVALQGGTAERVDAEAIHAFTAHYRMHAQLEEDWLFPLVAANLSDEELHRAGQHMAARRQSPA
ncbi:hemerythrin domain-containing protein [Pseudogulbenkiania sp. MAI-1]|uniref:hemerythrin domain-containing protein n=1 Tax=Pseudogulbenkiania sp. MAI-1 TaxID=990370 RepID=UPI00045E72A5|nr:hemerythrin domain-containing protein [Pseudogulbenkiania sp. MAI-1]